MTPKALAALETLKAMRPFVVEHINGVDVIQTGINSRVLDSLFSAGAITCRTMFLGGRVTSDLVIND